MAKVKFNRENSSSVDISSIGTKSLIERLNKALIEFEDFRYYDFLTSNKIAPNTSILKGLQSILPYLTYEDISLNSQINLTEGEQLQVIIDFYYSLSLELGEKVENMFSSRQGLYKMHLAENKSDPHYGKNQISFNFDSTQMEFFVTLSNNSNSLRRIAHECCHAMSAADVKMITLIRNKNLNKTEENENLCNQFYNERTTPQADCTCEIESYIIELLFNEYLLNCKIISNEDAKNYEIFRTNALHQKLNLIAEECEIISHLTYPITEESYKQFQQSIENLPNKKALKDRLIRMSNNLLFNTKHESIAFNLRYVIADIVSMVWYQKFKTAGKKERRNMLKNFTNYLNTTDETHLYLACEELLNMSLAEVIDKLIRMKEQTLEF